MKFLFFLGFHFIFASSGFFVIPAHANWQNEIIRAFNRESLRKTNDQLVQLTRLAETKLDQLESSSSQYDSEKYDLCSRQLEAAIKHAKFYESRQERFQGPEISVRQMLQNVKDLKEIMLGLDFALSEHRRLENSAHRSATAPSFRKTVRFSLPEDDVTQTADSFLQLNLKEEL